MTAVPDVSYNVLARFAHLPGWFNPRVLYSTCQRAMEGDRNRIAARESCHRRVRIIRSADVEAAQINHEIWPSSS